MAVIAAFSGVFLFKSASDWSLPNVPTEGPSDRVGDSDLEVMDGAIVVLTTVGADVEGSTDGSSEVKGRVGSDVVINVEVVVGFDEGAPLMGLAVTGAIDGFLEGTLIVSVTVGSTVEMIGFCDGGSVTISVVVVVKLVVVV